MPLHFTREEFAERCERALEAMAALRLDALLRFEQASMYWLAGYDIFGQCFFRCLVLRAEGDLVLLTHAPDLRQARHARFSASPPCVPPGSSSCGRWRPG